MSDQNCAGLGPVGLIWVGEKFYPTPRAFLAEAKRMGISRRISAVPKGFMVGETWVLFAHRKVEFDGELAPGIFYLARPERIEKIVTETQARDPEEMGKLRARGIVPVIVPDNDPDHNPGAEEAEEDLDQIDLFAA